MKQHLFSAIRDSHKGRHHWRLVLLTCVMLLGLPFSAAQATPELAQPDQVTTTAYLPLMSTGETDTPPPPDPQAPRFEPGACPIAPPSGVEVTCGYLSVPESRQQPTEQRLQLAVMIVHATGDNPAPDPVVFLQGGPGGGAIGLTSRLVQEYAPIVEQRDLVMIDQRGTGFSRPTLPCPYPTFGDNEQTMAQHIGLGSTPQEEDPIEEQLAFFTECYTTLTQAGIDVTAYTSAENAADLADLQEALNYPSINLIGASYGTRLALTMMRDHPDGIRSVVMDSVSPTQKASQVEIYASFAQALENLFDDCAADTTCNTAYPDLATVFDTLVERLNTTPVEIPITDPTTREETTTTVTGDDLTNLLFELFYITNAIPSLPKLISDANQEDYELLSFALSQPSGSGISEGMYIAVRCSGDLSFVTAEDFRAGREAHPRAAPLARDIGANEAFLDVCEAWDLPEPDPIENDPVVSDIDTLIITGEYDPITQAQWGDLVAETLENSFVIPTYPRGGHVPSLFSPCLTNGIAEFLDNPAAEPDVSCIEDEAPLPFVVDQDEARSAIEEAERMRLP